MALSLALADRAQHAPASVHRTLVYAATAVAALAVYEGLVGQAVLEGLYGGEVRGFVPSGIYFRPPATIGNPLVASSLFVGVFSPGY